MRPAAAGQREGLIDACLHVCVVALGLIVVDQSALPEGRDGLDALQLVGLFPTVGHDRQLVAAQVAFAGKLIEDNVLHEVGLHEVRHSDILR